jgi:hypothetical protein
VDALLKHGEPAMTTKAHDAQALEDQTAHLELMLIEQFIQASGYDPARLGELRTDERERLQHEATAYAAGKLAEVESRAHLIHELHGQR